MRGLVEDDRGDHGEYDGAGEGDEIADLAGAEAEALLRRVTARVGIGGGCCPKHGDMPSHVQTVRQQRDGTERRAGNNLRGHHERGQHHHDACAARIPVVRGSEITMIAPPGRKRIGKAGHVDDLPEAKTSGTG